LLKGEKTKTGNTRIYKQHKMGFVSIVVVGGMETKRFMGRTSECKKRRRMGRRETKRHQAERIMEEGERKRLCVGEWEDGEGYGNGGKRCKVQYGCSATQPFAPSPPAGLSYQDPGIVSIESEANLKEATCPSNY
jgi:hypothetical protein